MYIRTIQSILVISTSLISNNRIYRSENLVRFNTEIYQQAKKHCGKEEKLSFRSNFSSFPQYFRYICNLGVKLYIHSVKCGCSINCFPQFRKSDMSKYGYLEVFHRVPWISKKRGSTVFRPALRRPKLPRTYRLLATNFIRHYVIP